MAAKPFHWNELENFERDLKSGALRRREGDEMISKDLEANILRLHFVEKWRVGTIASQLYIHHEAVERVLNEAGVPAAEQQPRPSIADPYIPFITDTLRDYPKICASRIFQMVRERGYPGGPDHFRSIVASLRPRRIPEAYLRLKTLRGEQGQVDWGHFGKVAIGRAQRQLMAFVMVLSWSRMIFLRFFLDQRIANLMRGHQGAFAFFGGVPRVLLYDNPKNVVLERIGDAIRFHPTLLAFAAHHRYEPRPVAVARGNEKGRVERAIRYVRTSFFPARKWKDLDDLNRQALEWCTGLAADRRCPEDTTLTVGEAFDAERGRLLPIPENPFPTEEREEVTARKTPYVRFDLNDYSIPFTRVGRPLVVLADLKGVRILDKNEVVAEHPRSYGRGEQIEIPDHIEQLVARKKQARKHRGLDRLSRQVRNASNLLEILGERGGNLGSATARLLRYVDDYGAEQVEAAITEAIERGTPHPNSVKFLLERKRRETGRPVPIPIQLSDDPRIRDLSVRPHSLASYDPDEEVSTHEQDANKVTGESK